MWKKKMNTSKMNEKNILDIWMKTADTSTMQVNHILLLFGYELRCVYNLRLCSFLVTPCISVALLFSLGWNEWKEKLVMKV